jgi:hypothetical protein
MANVRARASLLTKLDLRQFLFQPCDLRATFNAALKDTSHMAKSPTALPPGTPILFRAAEVDFTITRKTPLGGKAEQTEGSVHHPAYREFGGVITATHSNGRHDIVIFPPGREIKHLNDVEEGEGAGQLEAVL